jgi:hypothetical protein
MDQIQIVAAANRYKSYLPAAEEFMKHENVPTHMEQLKHCAWMCNQITSGSMDREKAMRWLCFVQGVLWSSGRMDIPSMKDDNRSKKPVPKPPVSPPPPAADRAV